VTPNQKTLAPRIAIVIPVFRHSALLCEAIESALTQDASFGIHVLVINDGCPHEETEQVCLEYATAYPDRLTYLRKKNGGLSSARNHGIQYALRRWTALDAIYLLDADNRLRSSAMFKGMELLDKNPDVDWVYPNIDMFGVRWAGDYGGQFSLINQAMMNTCEAGSLIRRRVFDAGVMFDTEMKLGFEDWDFFISASEHGFKGKNGDELGFQYRKRPESMLADSTRDEAEILAHMRRKHREYFSPITLVGLEQTEAPRYAIFLADSSKYVLTVDPGRDGVEVSPSEYEEMLWASLTARGRIHAPSHLVITTSAALRTLRDAGLLHWALWRLEEAVESFHLATITHTESGDDVYRVKEQFDANGGEHLRSMLVMMNPRCLIEILKDEQSAWIDSVVRQECNLRLFNLSLEFGAVNSQADATAPMATMHSLLAQIHRLRGSRYRASAFRKWDWREEGIAVRHHPYLAARRQLDGGVTYPRLREGSPNVGFLLPLVDFGGVEKVALNIAREMKAAGWKPHLIVLEQNSCVFSPEMRAVFESVSFLCDSDQQAWDGDASYFGTDIPVWARRGKHSRAAGMLYWLDAVVNCHGAGAHGLMGQLRRLGVTTIASLHLNDETKWARPVGHPYLTLAYEHAYDLITTCSEQLAHWCHGMGIPEQKVIFIPNAPSYRLHEPEVSRILEQRRRRPPSQPLRILFLGRLDRQKGLPRLEAVFESTVASRLEVEWRIVGKSVVGSDALPAGVQEVLEPSVTSPKALTALYEWADVLLLLSDFEGLPLTVLEAMRVGVTCICTDVGAVSEAVTDEENGFLVNPETAVQDCVSILHRLCDSRALCVATANAAAAASQQRRDWSKATQQLVEAVVRLRAEKLQSKSIVSTHPEVVLVGS
jgi:glycosyltransferase involved in cell wall biosynthesis